MAKVILPLAFVEAPVISHNAFAASDVEAEIARVKVAVVIGNDACSVTLVRNLRCRISRN